MLSVFSKFITSFFESDEETLSIMRWLYLVTLCVELAASKNPDGKFFPPCFFKHFLNLHCHEEEN